MNRSDSVLFPMAARPQAAAAKKGKAKPEKPRKPQGPEPRTGGKKKSTD